MSGRCSRYEYFHFAIRFGNTMVLCHCHCWKSITAAYPAHCPQVMGKNKVLVKVHPEGKYVVDLDKSIDITQVCTNGTRHLGGEHCTKFSKPAL